MLIPNRRWWSPSDGSVKSPYIKMCGSCWMAVVIWRRVAPVEFVKKGFARYTVSDVRNCCHLVAATLRSTLRWTVPFLQLVVLRHMLVMNWQYFMGQVICLSVPTRTVCGCVQTYKYAWNSVPVALCHHVFYLHIIVSFVPRVTPSTVFGFIPVSL